METTTQIEIPAGAGESSLNPDTLNQPLGQMVNDLGAAVNGALIVLGDGLGIYTALADIGPATSQKLAEKTNLNERQLREWLSAQAASGYVSYDGATDSFSLTPEQTAVFADPDSPAAMIGGFYAVSAVYHDEPARRRKLPDWTGTTLGRASQLPFLRNGEVFQTRLSG
jgi:Rv2258c-like winged HTH domain